MSAGSTILDASGRRILCHGGKRTLSNGVGDSCICGCDLTGRVCDSLSVTISGWSPPSGDVLGAYPSYYTLSDISGTINGTHCLTGAMTGTTIVSYATGTLITGTNSRTEIPDGVEIAWGISFSCNGQVLAGASYNLGDAVLVNVFSYANSYDWTPYTQAGVSGSNSLTGGDPGVVGSGGSFVVNGCCGGMARMAAASLSAPTYPRAEDDSDVAICVDKIVRDWTDEGQRILNEGTILLQGTKAIIRADAWNASLKYLRSAMTR